MADIEYIIGAKDKATEPINKVDGALAKLERSTKQVAEASAKSMSKIDVSFKNLVKGAGVIAVATAAVSALRSAVSGIIGSIGAANDAYDTQTEAVKGLETALRLNGEAVEGQSEKLQKFASDLQRLTGIGDELTLGLMRQASMLGVSTDQLDDAAKAAIGLSEATGKSLDESLKLVKNSLEGEFGALGEVIPAIKRATTAEEKLAMVQSLSTKGLDSKIAASDRLAGMTDRAAGAIGDLMESVGALLAPVRILIASGVKVLAESLQHALVPAVAMAEAVMENLGPIMDWVKEKIVQGVNVIIGAFTFLEVVVTNLPAVWEMMVASAELQVIRLSEAVKHVFTGVIPQYLNWFGENFTNIIRDIFVGAVTIVQNRLQNIGDMIARTFDFIASGMQGGVGNLMRDLGQIATRNLLEGFEASTEALPDIVGRKITERELELQEKIGGIASDLGQQFSDKFAERVIGLGEGVGDSIDKEIDLKLNKKVGEKLGASGGGEPKLQLTEGRLLSRGPAEKQENYLQKIAINSDKQTEQLSAIGAAQAASASELAQIKNNQAGAPVLQLQGVP